MQNSFQPDSNHGNYIAVRLLTWQIIHDVASDEEVSAEKLSDIIAKAWEEGRLIPARMDATNNGGFGNIDLLLLVVIPVIMAVLKELGKSLATQDIDLLKKWISENKDSAIKTIDLTVEREYETVNQTVKSKKARVKAKAAKQAIKTHLKKQLGIEK